MVEPVNPNDLVSLEELAISNIREITALVETKEPTKASLSKDNSPNPQRTVSYISSRL